MQTVCTKCSNSLVVDDAKVPAGPFMLRCPRCQATMKLPGKGPSLKNDASSASTPRAPSPPGPDPSVRSQSGPRASTPAAAPTNGSSATALPETAAPPTPGKRESPVASVPMTNGGAGRALVSLGSAELRQAASSLLSRHDYAVEVLEGEEQLGRLFQGDYAVVVTELNGNHRSPAYHVYQRIHELSSELRRRLFLVVVDPSFTTGDPTQAFATVSDLVVRTGDVAMADKLFRDALAEKGRVYQTFFEAESRLQSETRI